MKTKNEDRKRTLRFYRTQAKACKLLLEKEPELSVEAKEWLQVYHNYFTECHKSILKRLPIFPDRPNIPVLSESIYEEIKNAVKKQVETLKNA